VGDPCPLPARRGPSGTTSPASAGSVTTSGPALLIFAASNTGTNVFDAPTPDTWIAMTGVKQGLMQGEWYRVADTAGTFAPTVSETGHVWDAALVAFRYVP
jgi:hypothetical protein